MRRALPDAAAAVGTILLAVGAWLSLPRERAGYAPTLPALRIVLVDTSASAVSRRTEWSRDVRRLLSYEAEEAERGGEEFCLITFSDDVRRLLGPASVGQFRSWLLDAAGVPLLHASSPRAGYESRISAALEVALELARNPGRAGCRVVLLGDGTYTGADPSLLLGQLGTSGAVLTRADLPSPSRMEVIPGPLSLPIEVEAGAPIAVEFDVFYAPGDLPRQDTVEFVLRDLGGPRLGVPVPKSVALDEDGYLRWRFRGEIGRAEPGWNPIRILGAGGGTGPASDGGVRGTGARVVGLLGCREPFVEHPGIEFEQLELDEVAGRLPNLDAFVTGDVPLDQLPIPILRSFVERGGGWFAYLDHRSAPRLSPDAPGMDLLPLRPPDDLEPRDVVFLVDRSGSMSGEASENVREAVFALLDEALPEDSVELRWFSDRLAAPIHLIGPEDARSRPAREEARRMASDKIFADRSVGGPTAILRALEELASERERSGGEALVLLLTDGRENTDSDPVSSAPRILERLRAARARLVVFAAGGSADRELLARLVAPGEELIQAGDLGDRRTGDSMRELFRREVQRDRFRVGAGLRIRPARRADPGAPTVGTDILQAMGPDTSDDWPTIRRHLRTRVAPPAEVLWVSGHGDPLLALHRVGLGLVAACPFSMTPEATPSGKSFDELLLPLLRALARGKHGNGPDARVERDELVVDGLSDDAPAELEARVFDSTAAEGDPPLAVIALSPPTEGQDPRRVRRGRWPVSDRGGFAELWDKFEASERSHTALAPRLEIRARAEGSSWAPIQLAITPPRAPEFILPRPRVPPFEPSASNPRRSDPAKASVPHPSSPWVLLSGMILLTGAGLAGVFSRRSR